MNILVNARFRRSRCQRSRFAAAPMRLLALGLVSVCVTVSADINKSGSYVTAFGGINTLSDTTVNASVDNTSSRGDASFSPSYLVGAAVGYRFANNWAVEEEVSFRRLTLDDADLQPLGRFRDGNFENTQLTAKVLYHFPVRGNRDVEAYAGLGLAWLSELDFDVEDASGEQPFENDEFGYELYLGARYHGWEHAFIGAGLRYLRVDDAQLKDPANNEDVVRVDYDPLALEVSFGWRF